MELKVLVQGPDTVHPIVVTAPDEVNPLQSLSAALAQNKDVVEFGDSVFRTDRVLAVIVTHSFVDGGGLRGNW